MCCSDQLNPPSNSDLGARNREFRFTPVSEHRQSDHSGPKSANRRHCRFTRPPNPGIFELLLALSRVAVQPVSFKIEDGPIVGHRNDVNHLGRKCGNIGPLKYNGYFDRFPHRRDGPHTESKLWGEMRRSSVRGLDPGLAAYTSRGSTIGWRHTGPGPRRPPDRSS